MNTPPSHDESPERLLAIRKMREQTYLPDEQAPYHGVSHPDVVWEKAKLLIDRCKQLGIAVDTKSLHDAIELHDALSHVDPKLLGFSSSEHLAATLTERFLVSVGHSQETAHTVGSIVMATNPDVRPRTPEEIIIRAADIWNIGNDYKEFVDATRSLHQEAMNRRQEEIPFKSFLVGSYGYLQKFLWPMLELTDTARDSEGRSVWHVNALRNLSQQWRDTFGDETPVVAELFPTGAISPYPATQPHTFYIAMHPDEEHRKDALEITRNSIKGCNGAAFVIPSTESAFSLPDNTCASVILHEPSPASVREALRVAKNGGAIMLPMRSNLDPSICEIAQSLRSVTIAPREEGLPATLVIFKELVS